MRKNGRSLAGGSATDGRRATLTRLRGTEGATRRRAGWIAEASPNYFTKITNCFLYVRIRQQSEGLAPVNYRPESVHAFAIISRLIFGDRIPDNQKAAPHEAQNPRSPIPARTNLTNPPKIATQLHPPANVGTPAQLLPNRHQEVGKFLRVFPQRGGIFDRRFKNAHIISTALPTAVGPSLRTSSWQAGQAKRLRNARRITMSFRTRRPLRGLQEPGPATHHSAGGPSSCVSGVSHVLAPGAVRLRKSCRLCPYD